MQLSDFFIGLVFRNSAQSYRCTDVGTRTITAIALNKDDERWYVGPPYMVDEITFDEKGMKRLFVTSDQALLQAVHESFETDLTYPHGAVKAMMRAKYDPGMAEYPNKALLRHDKLIGGEIHHPYAASKVGDEWVVKSFLPYLDAFAEIPEAEFRDSPMAAHQDYVDSKARHRNS